MIPRLSYVVVYCRIMSYVIGRYPELTRQITSPLFSPFEQCFFWNSVDLSWVYPTRVLLALVAKSPSVVWVAHRGMRITRTKFIVDANLIAVHVSAISDFMISHFPYPVPLKPRKSSAAQAALKRASCSASCAASVAGRRFGYGSENERMRRSLFSNGHTYL